MIAETYRPRTLDEIIGQDDTIARIRRALARIDRGAWLFTGPKGCGKTSAALAVAAQIAECEWTGRQVIESRTADLERIRRIDTDSQTCPARGKWKVYVIDEVHAVAQGGQDYLLGLLESLPKYRLIIGTTTEVHPFKNDALETRWTRFRFQPIDRAAVESRVDAVAAAEGVSLPTEPFARADWFNQVAWNLRAALNALEAT